MVDYLCRTGAPPAFLSMPKLNSNAVERQDAYFEQVRKNGHDGALIPTPGKLQLWQFERYGFEVMEHHFSNGRYLDATILCANDRIAFGAIRAANTHGLFLSRAGEARGQLRIAVHDDHPLSRYIFPALTTVAQEVGSIGSNAVDLLVGWVRNGREGAANQLALGGTLRIRECA